MEKELTDEQIMWLRALIKEYPKHIGTSPETFKLLDEKYVRRWIILLAFTVIMSIMGYLYTCMDNVKTKLEVYKEDMWSTVIETNKEISEIKSDVSGIKANLESLTNMFNKFNITIE